MSVASERLLDQLAEWGYLRHRKNCEAEKNPYAMDRDDACNCGLTDRIVELKAEASLTSYTEAAQVALNTYGQHLNNCSINVGCTCGLAEAILALKTAK